MKKQSRIEAFKPGRITRLVRARRSTPDALLKAKSAADAASEIQARLRELIKLAKEQGYLTFDELNEALPDGITDANELDAILTRLRRMEIDVIEASDVDRHKEVKKDLDEEEEEKPETKLDILDDPVSLNSFMSKLSAEEEGLVSAWLMQKVPANAMEVAESWWKGLMQGALRRQLEIAETRIRLPQLTTGEVVNLQKEIVDLREQLHQISGLSSVSEAGR